MKQLRVCIGTNDETHIAQSHLGDTGTFLVYDVSPGNDPVFIDKRENTVNILDHAKSNKMKEVLKILDDVNVLVAAELSPNFKNIANKTRYQPVVVKSVDITDVLAKLTATYDHIDSLVARRIQGERFAEIPEI